MSENGINTDRDEVRVRHLRATVAGLAAAMDGGLPVLGYIFIGACSTISNGARATFPAWGWSRSTAGRSPSGVESDIIVAAGDNRA